MRGVIVDLWRRRRLTRPRLNRVRAYPTRAELPANLPRHELAIIGDRIDPKWLVFECPCGEGHRLQLNLAASQAVRWRLEKDGGGGPSVSPSIDYRGPDRRCHFWLRRGRVDWVKDRSHY